jgi:toxin-antitoxin system PIN domain toxin
VTILDANILLYAYNADSPKHVAAAHWLEELFSGPDVIGLPWVTLWAFLRISTNPRVWSNPKSAQEAFTIVRAWLAQPGVVVVDPGPRHAELLEELVTKHSASGPIVSDAALAALALENGAILASTDRDFSRFPHLRWVNPLP